MNKWEQLFLLHHEQVMLTQEEMNNAQLADEWLDTRTHLMTSEGATRTLINPSSLLAWLSTYGASFQSRATNYTSQPG